ncbi:MAG: hypothetical protein ACRELD_09945 [Longimicrobiales bacterium]
MPRQILAAAAALTLLVLPGCWPVFAFRTSALPFSTRLALAVVLSPFIVGLQAFALRLAGIELSDTVLPITLINLGGLVLLLRSMPRGRSSWRPAVVGAAAFAVVAACVAIPWLLEPWFRAFSWHSLIQTDIIYALGRGSVLPEDPELAGVSLVYPWFAHLYWFVLAWTVDLAPTRVYVATNLVLLAATGVLYYQTARELGASEEGSLAAPLLLALGIGVTGLIGWSLLPPNDSGIWWALLGDLRYAPFLQKFSAFEVMNFGLAAYVALTAVTVIGLRRMRGPELLLAPLVAASVGALYPPLFPAAILHLGAFVAVIAIPRFGVRQAHTRALLLLLLAGSAAAAVLGLVGLELSSLGRHASVVAISSPAAAAKKLSAAFLACAPFAWAGYVLWRREVPARRQPLLVLGAAAAASVLLNIVLRLPTLAEYKFIYTAGICLLPPAIVCAERALQHRWQRRLILAALPPALALVMIAYAGDQLPQRVSRAVGLREDSFWLRLAPAEPAAGWTDAIRTRSPENTVLVVNRPDFHVSAFTARTLLVPTQREEPHLGVALDTRAVLLNIRGYDPRLVERRLAVLDDVYGRQPERWTAALAGLRSLGRPVAIVIQRGDDAGFVDWLRGEGIGATLFDDERNLVYQLPASEIEPGAGDLD